MRLAADAVDTLAAEQHAVSVGDVGFLHDAMLRWRGGESVHRRQRRINRSSADTETGYCNRDGYAPGALTE